MFLPFIAGVAARRALLRKYFDIDCGTGILPVSRQTVGWVERSETQRIQCDRYLVLNLAGESCERSFSKFCLTS
ncbi:MAG: hypothetical protein F6K14_07990 [Symploca sp. SIO2C1]|nr:hypothetical protein [Symploca sp. SIO2C1]